MSRPDVVIIGGGIIGLSVGWQLGRRGLRVAVLEKESSVGAHQTGHNSGVIHSGLYYRPGSLKSTLGVAGARSMLEFARTYGVPAERCGKLVVATSREQVPMLDELHRRALAASVPCVKVSGDEALEYEPHVRAVAALRVESTGIIDYSVVCQTLVRLIEEDGGSVRPGHEVTGISSSQHGVVVTTDRLELQAGQLVNCAGLQSDRVARLAGFDPEIRILPFRGEYYEVSREHAHLVRGLIYPVPDPTLPFLGVHLTRNIDGVVHAGPNAVLAMAREGYTWGTVRPGDLWESARWPGTWRLGRRHWRTGATEIARSLSRRRFLTSLRDLVPELPDDSIVRSRAGVRAQAVRRDGSLADDFVIQRRPRQVHVLNAPSPAATASIEIGRHIVGEMSV